MKKILSIALVAVVLSAMIVDTASAARTMTDNNTTSKRRMANKRGMMNNRRGMNRGKGRRGPRAIRSNARQVQVVLATAQQTDNPAAKAEAIRTANELAKELLMDVQDRTWAGDILPGRYTEEQIANAGSKYADLEVQKQALERDIKAKQDELEGMSARSMLFWTKAEGGKEEAHKIASEELADMKATLKEVNKAMRNQAVIAGKEYCSAIRMAIGAMTAVAIAGGIAVVDQVATGGKYTKIGMDKGRTMYNATTTAIGSEYDDLKTKGIRQYSSERSSAAYGAVAGKISDMGSYASDKIAGIREYVSSLYGSKADAPADVQKKEEIAVKKQQIADAGQAKADQTGSPVDQKRADGQQEVADGAAKALESAAANNPA